MSYSSLLPSSHLLAFPSLFSVPKPHKPRTTSLSLSNDHQPPPDDDDDAKRYPNLLNLSATAVIVSAALPQPPAHAKPKSKKPSASPAALSPDEARSWAQGIPVVADKIPYSDVLELKREGKVKHVVKLAAAALRRRPEPVLVVMADDTVWRTVLPPEYGDARFWGEWDELGMGSLCVNAYTPPIKKPEIPAPYLGVFAKALEFALSKVRAKPRTRRAVELEQARRELQLRRKTEVERVRLQREMVERAARAAKKAEERRRRKEARLAEQEQSMRQARRDYQKMALVWANMAQDQTTAYLLGFAFFGLFYYFVVYRYKKQKKDFEDRLKIEKAEAEERKKMRELEKELAGIEEDGDEVDGEGGERNPYSKIMKFVRSGARVRRARSRRLPQYLERGADVKFSDVAGLGKIRVELEEIVKFFTLGEMYRRRGVKIPGLVLSIFERPCTSDDYIVCQYIEN